MAKRKRRTVLVKVARHDQGTPETRGKLVRPFYATLDHDLVIAATRIREADLIQFGELYTVTLRLSHLPRPGDEDWTAEQKRLVEQYKAWVKACWAKIGTPTPFLWHIVHDEPVRDKTAFTRAMQLYCKINGIGSVKAA